MSKPSPTQLTLAVLKQQGCLVEKVEHWNPYSKTRHDLFGFADIIILQSNLIDSWESGYTDTILIQCTTMANRTSRIAKITANDNARKWLTGQDNFIEVWAWRPLRQRRKDGKLGKRIKWEPEVTEIRLEDLEP